MTVKIEKAKTEDISIIKDLLKKLYEEVDEEGDSADFLSDELIAQMMGNGNTIILKAIIENKITGIITLTETQAIYADGTYGIIDELFVEEGYRSKKVGKLLIDEACNIAKLKKWKRLAVTAPTKDFDRQQKFYESNKFEFTGPKLKRTNFN